MKKRLFLACSALALVFNLFGQVCLAATDVKIGKVASELDENLQTEITLSVPNEVENIKRDIVLILDASDCADFTQSSLAKLINDLKAEIKNTNVQIKVGVILFKGNAVSLGWKDINSFNTNSLQMQAALAVFTSGLKMTGTNIDSGLLAAQTLLASDTEVPDNMKTVFILSDGISYLFTKNRDPKTDYDISHGLTRGPEDRGYESLLKEGQSWEEYFKEIGANYQPYITDEYAFRYNGTSGFPKALIPDAPLDGTTRTVSNVDASLYQSNLYYRELAAKYDTYAIHVGEPNDSFYWGEDFMKYLAESNPSNAETLNQDFLDMVRAESYIYDEIGYGNTFNFDTLNSPDMYDVVLGDENLTKTEISETKFGFGDPYEVNGETFYPYTVEYFADSSDTKEHLIWTINRPIKQYEQVEFKYHLELTRCAGGEDLYTNNFATLYSKNGNGDSFTKIDIEKPVLSHDEEVGFIPEDIPESPKTSDELPIYALGFVISILAFAISVKSSPAKK